VESGVERGRKECAEELFQVQTDLKNEESKGAAFLEAYGQSARRLAVLTLREKALSSELKAFGPVPPS